MLVFLLLSAVGLEDSPCPTFWLLLAEASTKINISGSAKLRGDIGFYVATTYIDPMSLCPAGLPEILISADTSQDAQHGLLSAMMPQCLLSEVR